MSARIRAIKHQIMEYCKIEPMFREVVTWRIRRLKSSGRKLNTIL